MKCKHFPECGGCQTMDLGVAADKLRKRDHVLSLCQREGISTSITDFFQVSEFTRRRASFTAKRTKKSVQLGFLSASSHHIVDLQECLVLHPIIFDFIQWVRGWIPEIASRSAMIKLHVTLCDNGLDIAIDNAKPISPELRRTLAADCETAHIRRLLVNDETVYFDGSPFVIMERIKVTIPPRAFLQATEDSERYIRKRCHEALSNCKHIVDLFSGVGTLVYGSNVAIDAFEGDRKLTAAHIETINSNQISNIRAQTRDLFRDPLMPNELSAFDGVMIDPPRAGAQAQIEQIAKTQISKLAYVSCNPISFARDAAILYQGGYKIDALYLVDQFRFSNHIELIAQFSKSA